MENADEKAGGHHQFIKNMTCNINFMVFYSIMSQT